MFWRVSLEAFFSRPLFVFLRPNSRDFAMPMAVGVPGDGNPQRGTVSPTRPGRKSELACMRMRPCMSMRPCAHAATHAKPCLHGMRAWHVSCASFAWNRVRISNNYSCSYYEDARKQRVTHACHCSCRRATHANSSIRSCYIVGQACGMGAWKSAVQ